MHNTRPMDKIGGGPLMMSNIVSMVSNSSGKPKNNLSSSSSGLQNTSNSALVTSSTSKHLKIPKQ